MSGEGAWSLKEEQVRQWAAETLLALEALHQQGVLCRDLNPRNLLLDQAGRSPRRGGVVLGADEWALTPPPPQEGGPHSLKISPEPREGGRYLTVPLGHPCPLPFLEGLGQAGRLWLSLESRPFPHPELWGSRSFDDQVVPGASRGRAPREPLPSKAHWLLGSPALRQRFQDD